MKQNPQTKFPKRGLRPSRSRIHQNSNPESSCHSRPNAVIGTQSTSSWTGTVRSYFWHCTSLCCFGIAATLGPESWGFGAFWHTHKLIVARTLKIVTQNRHDGSFNGLPTMRTQQSPTR
jgi:hypothetical protein